MMNKKCIPISCLFGNLSFVIEYKLNPYEEKRYKKFLAFLKDNLENPTNGSVHVKSWSNIAIRNRERGVKVTAIPEEYLE